MSENGEPLTVSHYDRAVAHMNADHADALAAIVGDQIGVAVGNPTITAMDDDGFEVAVEVAGEPATVRVAFPHRATPATIRDLMVAMTEDARAGGGPVPGRVG